MPYQSDGNQNRETEQDQISNLFENGQRHPQARSRQKYPVISGQENEEYCEDEESGACAIPGVWTEIYGLEAF